MNSVDIAIKAQNVSKLYRLGVEEEKRDSFIQTMFDFVRSPLNNYRKYRSLYKFDNCDPDSDSNSSDIIWALRNISFEVKKGEALGIIGRNGAGKSTLLKILSRITDPINGRIEIYGKHSSLLEVGTGFHQELTGRENVYLNGAVLGMKKKELDYKFEDIVNFSGVGRFIDTPVKRYSSGMKVRLAFAVAAHLEPEILIVDEVLAVGDAEFQMKCIGKMGSLAKGGRTVIFVSHNMGAITELCNRVLWLDEGRLKLDGPSLDVVTKYMSAGMQETTGFWASKQPEEGSGRIAWLRHAQVRSGDKDKVSTLAHYDEQVKIEIEYEIKSSVRSFRSYLLLRDSSGVIIWSSHDTDGTGKIGLPREAGIYYSTCLFPERMLRPGNYYVSIGIYGKPREAVEEEHLDVLSFQISSAGYSFARDQRKGIITPDLIWDIRQQQDKLA